MLPMSTTNESDMSNTANARLSSLNGGWHQMTPHSTPLARLQRHEASMTVPKKTRRSRLSKNWAVRNTSPIPTEQ
jgi:hypothetical protein